MHTSTGRSSEACHLFHCRAVRSTEGQHPEATEFIEVVEIPFGKALSMPLNGGISDAASVLGLVLVSREFVE